MTRAQTTNRATTRKLLYTGAAGQVWTDGLELYQLKAQGIGVMGIMPGTPTSQPTPEEMAAVQQASKNAFGKLNRWLVTALLLLAFIGLEWLGVPTWTKWIFGVITLLVVIALPVYRQYQAFQGLFQRRDEVTILLSDTPTQMISSMVEVGPDTPAQEVSPARQPVAVVVRGLPLAERIKLAGVITRHVALSGRIRK